MNGSPEFAPKHSRATKIRVVALYLLAGGATVLLSQAWLFPALSAFASSADCREVFGVSGVKVLFYGLFLGVPLFCALVVGLTIGRRGYRILRDGQLPPIGEKVFRPTRITRGTKAKWAGYLHLFSPLPLLAIAVWGLPQAHQLSRMSLDPQRKCAAGHAVIRTPENLRSLVPSGLRAAVAG